MFRDSKFKGVFYPRSAKFHGKVDFRKAEFNNADFHDTVFKDKANFRRSKILNRTRFLDVKFQDRANFVNTIFYNNIEFVGTKFNEAFFSPEVDFQTKIEFKYVVFENGEKIDFMTEDLSNVSFMNTDVTRVKFSDKAIWGDADKDKFKIIEERELRNFFERHIYWFLWDDVPGVGNRKFITYLNKLLSLSLTDNMNLNIKKSSVGHLNDTIEIYLGKNEIQTKIELKKDPMSVRLTYNKRTIDFYVKSFDNQCFVSEYQLTSLESIKAIYRNLRENYEYRLRYDEAGEFFIREMELKRNYHQDSGKNLKRSGLLKRRLSITGLYYSLFRYGERLLRPTLAVVIPFLGLSILLTSIAHNATLIDAVRISFSDMLHIELQEPLKPLLSDSIIRILSLGILGMYLIPLRRKFERKFRH